MRRLIAYISMCITILICVGIAFTPVFTNMTAGREFTNGNEIVYKITESNDSEAEISSGIVDKVASEMKSRLDTYLIEDYSIRVEGNDTIRVGLSVNSETKLNYISNYLCFNGKNFSLSGSEEETRVHGDKIFNNCTAYIVRKEDIIPYVIFPVSDTAAVKTLIEAVEGTSSSSEEEHSDKFNVLMHEDDGEDSSTPNIFMWANWEEGDTYDIAQKDQAVTGQKILCSFVSSNIWYEDELSEGEEPTELQFLCGYAKDSDSSEYDTTKLRQANELATYLCNMFNASSFEYYNKDYTVSNVFVTQSSSGVTNNQISTEATAENLLVYGNTINVRMSTTLIATLVAIVIVFLILVIFFRLGAIAIITNSIGSTFLGYTILIFMGATFNIAAIIGGILIAVANLFISILYFHKLKDEVYKGRALRKANQEAMKRINLPSIDIAVVSLFSGLMFYFLGGSALKPLGIMMFFGGLMSLLMTQIIFRIATWILTNSLKTSSNMKLLNIDEKLVPNLLQEEKANYVAPYENTNFTSKKKPVAIVTALLAIASVACICVFGILNGSPLNVSTATRDTVEIYTSIKNDKPTLDTVDSFKSKVLKNVYINDKELVYSDVDLANREEYDYETDITTKYTFFVTSLDYTFAKNDKFYATVEGNKEEFETLSEAIDSVVYEIEGESSEEYIVTEEKVSHETITTPHQGYVALACAIAIVGSCLYFAFRFKPSRGVAALVISSATTLISYGIFVICRIDTTLISSLVMPIATVICLVSCLLFFEKEKYLRSEFKNKLTPEESKQIMIKASSLCAAPLFISCIAAAYISINYFGFGFKSFSVIFIGMLFAVVISALLVTTLLGPTAELFSKWFKRIKLPEIKVDRGKKHRIKLQSKPKTSEPEETIFIGIND